MLFFAKDKVCDTLTPKHGESEARGADSSPYNLVQSHQDYNPGERVKGTNTDIQLKTFKQNKINFIS